MCTLYRPQNQFLVTVIISVDTACCLIIVFTDCQYSHLQSVYENDQYWIMWQIKLNVEMAHVPTFWHYETLLLTLLNFGNLKRSKMQFLWRVACPQLTANTSTLIHAAHLFTVFTACTVYTCLLDPTTDSTPSCDIFRCYAVSLSYSYIHLPPSSSDIRRSSTD